MQHCREGIWLRERLFYSSFGKFNILGQEPQVFQEKRGHLSFGNKTGIPLPVRAGREKRVPKLEMGKRGFSGLTSSEPVGRPARG